LRKTFNVVRNSLNFLLGVVKRERKVEEMGLGVGIEDLLGILWRILRIMVLGLSLYEKDETDSDFYVIGP
jgi:hypothetical protein